MKMLIVSALVCAMMVLTRAAAPPEETPPEETESRLVKRSTACPPGWSLSGGRCYHYNPRNMTWAGAEKNCQAQGGNLASVHNIRQFFHVQKLIFQATRTYDLAWIGGSDAEENGQWFWSDGTPFRYRHWCHGESNDGVVGGQHCLQMNFSGHKCWDYIPCSNQLPSVCVMNSK
ncbi:type-2 ice-structuring protein-like [Epinephelus fuscoguttatus]|uniref:type-2 ice-structuring protein-like n=1 Tax=Epinephelus fuscoguttatus TaxID=293821 RepID=UPI0020D1E7EF|nr:type-2 ice-structuring protein-like [Epinephelus fuscoguttatus]XP_049424666.1 type-2 ice-structuring protein-like [Epinephelus fuscoguttatus]XP_049424667.1 type-2 ice-structuring protein-like [Epinephelus fuscoguttatus]